MKIILNLFFLTLLNKTFSQVPIKSEVYDFAGTDDNGIEIKLSDYKGFFILLNFTATFCGPCWDTYPQMNEVQKKYENSLKVVSFHFDDEKEKWEQIAKKRKLNFECTSIWSTTLSKNEIIKKYKVKIFPSYFLVDQNGIVLKRWWGNDGEKLKRILKKHLKTK